MISPAELQSLLREFGGGLANITVTPVAVAEHIVRIEGPVTVYGHTMWFETDFNSREIGGPEDVVRLAGLILKSLEGAEERMKK